MQAWWQQSSCASFYLCFYSKLSTSMAQMLDKSSMAVDTSRQFTKKACYLKDGWLRSKPGLTFWLRVLTNAMGILWVEA